MEKSRISSNSHGLPLAAWFCLRRAYSAGGSSNERAMGLTCPVLATASAQNAFNYQDDSFRTFEI